MSAKQLAKDLKRLESSSVATAEVFDSGVTEAAAAQMRKSIIEMLGAAGSGHPGGSLSATDIVATLYFGGVLHHDASNPTDPARDRFILSKGHAAPVLYAALAEAGYISKEELVTLRQLGSRLQGHPDSSEIPGVEVSTGSLGQGLSIGAGSALALKRAEGTQRVFVLLGDGELQEGQVWEAAMFAAHYQLSNLIAIVDYNNLQIDGACNDVMCLGDVSAKFAAFGWNVIETDGHDTEALHGAFAAAEAHQRDAAQPTVIIARTTKGKGVSFMENKAGWHGVAPNKEECSCALEEIDACVANAPEGGRL